MKNIGKYNLVINSFFTITLAEWLTRWPAKPFPFGSAGSSPAVQYLVSLSGSIKFILAYIVALRRIFLMNTILVLNLTGNFHF
ncbi:hypothetical protein U3516DRAFT_771704 [Neocallimastix sp. 'constans']